MPNIFIFCFIFFFSLSGFSQEEVKKDALSQEGGQVIIRETPPEASPEAVSPEGAPVAPEEADIVELEKERDKQLKQMELVQKSTDPLKNPLGNPVEEMKKLGHQQLNAMSLMDDKVVAILQQTLKDADFSKLTPEFLRASIKEKLKGHFLERVLERFPKLLDIAVDVLRSKEALSGLLGIFARKEDLKTYGYTWLAIFVFSALVKRRIVKPKWNFLRRMRWSMSISLILTSITLTVFYNFFSEEIGPTLSIIQKHLF